MSSDLGAVFTGYAALGTLTVPPIASNIMVGIAIVLKIVIVTFLVRWTRDIVRREAVPTSQALVVFGFVADWRRQPAGGARAAR